LSLAKVRLSARNEQVFVHELVLDRLPEILLNERVQFPAEEGFARTMVLVHLVDWSLAQVLDDVQRSDHCLVSLDEVKDLLEIPIVVVHAGECAVWVGEE
jgi:hypothetical protein